MPASKYAIAIVEDDASVSRALERLLRASGFETQTFASAEEFLGSATPWSHACLILDIHLPGMSGCELFYYLSASAQHPPAIFITGEEEETGLDQAYRIHDSVCLRKPLVGAVLLEAVHAILRRSGSSTG
jgi:FixJ family two-component response regulator